MKPPRPPSSRRRSRRNTMRFFGTRISFAAMLVASCLVTPVRAATESAEIALTVHEDAGIARTNEVAIGGAPFPKSAAVSDVNTLRLIDGTGKELPLQARV